MSEIFVNLNKRYVDELIALNSEKNVDDLLNHKLSLFKAKFEVGAEVEVLYELIYCLLTAQTKFYSAAAVLNELMYSEDFLYRFLNESDEDLRKYLTPILQKNIIRFHNNKAGNIIYARNLFVSDGKLILRETLSEFLSQSDDVMNLRDWLIDNVLGLSYKESSHFLRNIGFGQQLAILDRHVLRTLEWISLIDEVPKTLTSQKYIEFEKILMEFSNYIGISMDRLDFLLFILSKKHMEKSELDMLSLLADLK